MQLFVKVSPEAQIALRDDLSVARNSPRGAQENALYLLGFRPSKGLGVAVDPLVVACRVREEIQ